MVIYRDLTGETVCGWKYVSGKITAFLKPVKEISGSIKTKSVTCQTEYTIHYIEWTYNNSDRVDYQYLYTEENTTCWMNYNELHDYDNFHGGGGGSSGGGYPDNVDDSPITPDDVKFLDNKSKEMIKPLLEQIYKDCAGKSLMDGIGSLNVVYQEGITGISEYYPSTKTIKWWYLDDLPQGILLHELIHAYQKQNGTYKPNNANIEVEAFLAQYRYCAKNKQILWGNSDRDIKDAFDPYLANPSAENYGKMMKYVKGLSGYSNFTDYPEDRHTNTFNALFNCYK